MARGLCLLAFLPFALSMLAPAAHGQTEQLATRPDANSCRAFVQDFYDWYVPITSSRDDRFTVMLRPRKSSFGPKLWQMLAADDEAQSHANEIVGLDFDPILNSQDPSPKFIVKSATVKSDRCDAVVVGVIQGTEEEHVMPELIHSSGRWIFVNFHYQSVVAGKLKDSGDLVQALRDWARERARLAKEKPE